MKTTTDVMPAEAGIQAGWRGSCKAMDSRSKIAGMTTMIFARHTKTFGDSGTGWPESSTVDGCLAAFMYRST